MGRCRDSTPGRGCGPPVWAVPPHNTAPSPPVLPPAAQGQHRAASRPFTGRCWNTPWKEPSGAEAPAQWNCIQKRLSVGLSRVSQFRIYQPGPAPSLPAWCAQRSAGGCGGTDGYRPSFTTITTGTWPGCRCPVPALALHPMAPSLTFPKSSRVGAGERESQLWAVTQPSSETPERLHGILTAWSRSHVPKS